jgi:REP element-mobilizing transposase RayT
MNHDLNKHHRRSICLKGYDYTQQGAYFVTICTQDRACPFGEVVDGQMRLNDAGQLVEWTWQDLPNHVSNTKVAFVVMPNHVHGIIVTVVGAGSEPAPTKPAPTERYRLPEMVRQFKTFSARHINAYRGTPGVPVWQWNYYEHIIRNQESLNRIRQYILDNPQCWSSDRENPSAISIQSRHLWEA